MKTISHARGTNWSVSCCGVNRMNTKMYTARLFGILKISILLLTLNYSVVVVVVAVGGLHRLSIWHSLCLLLWWRVYYSCTVHFLALALFVERAWNTAAPWCWTENALQGGRFQRGGRWARRERSLNSIYFATDRSERTPTVSQFHPPPSSPHTPPPPYGLSIFFSFLFPIFFILHKIKQVNNQQT